MTFRILHVCSCGAALTAIDWHKLPLVGFEVDAAPGLGLEVRRHACGSSRSRQISLASAMTGATSMRDQARKEVRRLEEVCNRITAICDSQQAAGIDIYARPVTP